MAGNKYKAVTDEELTKLRHQALFGKFMAVKSIICHPFSAMILMFAMCLLAMAVLVTVRTQYSAIRGSLCVGFFLPEGEYEGVRGDDRITFSISKDGTKDASGQIYKVQIMTDGNDAPDRYDLYFRNGMLHLTHWLDFGSRSRKRNNVIVKNSDDSFSVLTELNGSEIMRFWEKSA